MEKLINAYVLTEKNKPLQFFKLQIPELKFGQVLVKIEYSGVCRSQLMEKKGLRGKDKWLPHLLGHEGSGKVIKKGIGVKKIKNGDEVILTWIKSNGVNGKIPKYFTNQNIKVNAGKVTTFSNYAIISENRVIKKPKLMPMKYASLFGCAIPTGAGIVINQIKPKKTDVIIVLGLGGIGLSSIMALKALKVKKIIAIDIHKKKLNLAKKIGATDLILFDKKNIKEKVRKVCDNSGADYCIESAGTSSTIELAFSLIHNKGKLIFASHPPKKDKIRINPHSLIVGKKIEGSWGGSTKPDKDIKKIFKLFLKNKVKYYLIAKKIYDFKNLNNALNDLDKGNVFRPIIKMSH
jgi:S-(hydroxymethyl)glutathione dehydrogenase/alcohol dehydrogenase